MSLLKEMRCRALWIQENELVAERLELAMERIGEIYKDTVAVAEFRDYFWQVSGYILMVKELLDKIEQEEFESYSYEELENYNRKLYEDLLPENYDTS